MHDFTDPEWGTRFLGDLYQDLSEEARKRYALLQTPEFVESWILDRTLEPAFREFGHERVTMIDPACGSGHFLLGGFERLLREWRRFSPGLPPAEQAQRALDAIAGVDLNPFAVEVARFRLLVASLRAAGVERMTSAPAFRIHLAVGDSLLHGRHFFRRELGRAEEGFRRVLRHHYAAEDTAEIDHILGRQYHAVVGNPPYITPKDGAMRDAYREIYDSCHMKYGLGVPFIERFFDLAVTGAGDLAAGFVGLIVANSFMKREFGSKLIEQILPQLDLTHVVDCSGAYIPGHGTPTAILFGRNQPPVQSVVRTVRGIRGEPSAPDAPAQGEVWSAIMAQTDLAQSTSDFISTEDTPRSALACHPWNMGGGGATEVQEVLEAERPLLGDKVFQIGFSAVTGADEVFAFGSAVDINRLIHSQGKHFVIGEDVRDYLIRPGRASVWLYDSEFRPVPLVVGTPAHKHMWCYRTVLSNRKLYGQPILQSGLQWYEYGEVNPVKQQISSSITFAFVATHNHFVFDRGGKVFNRSAPVIKLPAGASDDVHLRLVGLLNSSTACFWLRQVSHNKGAGGGTRVASGNSPLGDEAWESHFEFACTSLQRFPLAASPPLELALDLDARAREFADNLPAAVCARVLPTRDALDAAKSAADEARGNMIGLQEELDWHCYHSYGLIDDHSRYPEPPCLNLGERAFEILIARRMRAGTVESAWFSRHHSTPITDLPAHWSAEYRAVVERRIAMIESDAAIGLIERPEYKRRWVMDRWDDMEQSALRVWLLDRLENCPVWSSANSRLLSTNQLADLMRRDAAFMSVAALYAGRPDVEIEALTAELVAREAVPFVATLRYADGGLRKRAQWEETWVNQRREDAIDADVFSHREGFRSQAERRAQEHWRAINPPRLGEEPEPYAIRMQAGAAAGVDFEIDRLVAEEQRRRKQEEIGDIPVPPKYVTKDFQSTEFWRLRGGLDVPKERFVSFLHCQRDADGSLVVTWGGHNHLRRALAIAAYYQERKDNEGWPPERLVPLLTGVIELLPWLLQWHNDYDPNLGARMGDYFVDFVQTEARALGMTQAAVGTWTPPAAPRRGRSRKIAA